MRTPFLRNSFIMLAWVVIASVTAGSESLKVQIKEWDVPTEDQSTGNQRAYYERDHIGDLLIRKILSGYAIMSTKMGDEMLSLGYGSGSSIVK